MAKKKSDVLIVVSETNLKRAQERFCEKQFDDAVFHAALAVEAAANALILRLGGDESKDHRAISGLGAVMRRTRPEMAATPEFVQLIEKGAKVQSEVVHARYPIENARHEWIAPMEFYTKEKAEEVIETARSVVKTIWKYVEENL